MQNQKLDQAVQIVKEKLEEWTSLNELKENFLDANSSLEDWGYIERQIKSKIQKENLKNEKKNKFFLPWLLFILIIRFIGCLYTFKVVFESDKYWVLGIFYLGAIAEIALLYVLINRNSKVQVKVWAFVLFMAIHIVLWMFSNTLQLISAAFFMFLVFQIDFIWFIVIDLIIFIYNLVLWLIIGWLLLG